MLTEHLTVISGGLSLLSGVCAAGAAYFWARSALVAVPEARTIAQARADGGGISMRGMNETTVQVVEALRKQARHSTRGAAAAALAAGFQVLGSLVG